MIRDRLVPYVDPRKNTHYWIGKGSYVNLGYANANDSDIEAIKDGYITITPITVDNTSYDQVNTMKNIFNTDF